MDRYASQKFEKDLLAELGKLPNVSIDGSNAARLVAIGFVVPTPAELHGLSNGRIAILAKRADDTEAA